MRKLYLESNWTYKMQPMIFLLTDALRCDYPDKFKMNFIRACQQQQNTLNFQKVTPSTGFCEIIEYLSGTNASTHGMLCQITAKNDWFSQKPTPPFFRAMNSLTKHTKRIPKVRGLVNIVCEAISRNYIDPEMHRVRYNIPLNMLPYFRPTESLHEYTAEEFSNASNILVNLKNDGYTVDVEDFVKFNKVVGSDDDRVDRLVKKIEERRLADFTMIYIGYCEMAHFWEQTSDELAALMTHMDNQLARIDDALKSHTDGYNLTFVGDHGMVEVSRSYDIETKITHFIQKNNLTVGQDILFFIDSTCVRIWYHTTVVKELRSELSEIISSTIRDDLDTSQSDYLKSFSPEYGDQIFWLKPGAVFFPDFFGNTINVGMHGYDGNAEGQQGLMLSVGTHVPDYTSKQSAPLSEIFKVIEAYFAK